ncbi:hypothetical protein BWQ96_06589 [Gracilariopsis chorda]|uniref:Uncharacterized protein n=1 Tax=Gracilariopsis chorda TaxID=448386 RepID=A0A2V3INN3_9FLOR|nr:hypothetical protein BWQ96_06589 [Gracilariopsis chorda]|eukprot:PXF43684.1 hypothetical protein BWQ96_06589 [Gracilariopsis chorda]
MAGGRRPSSYVSGVRHSSAVDRQTVQAVPATQDGFSTPPLSSSNGPSLPPWIPSIWQPPPLRSPTQRPSRDKPASLDPSSALAAALDTAVQSAVVRALGSATIASQLTSSSCDSENGLEDETSQPLTQRENELLDLIVALKSRLHQRDDDIASLNNRMEALEHKLQQQHNVAQVRHENFTTDKAALTKHFSDSFAELDKSVEVRLTTVRDHVRSTNASVSKLRNANSVAEANITALNRRTRELSSQVTQLRTHMKAEFERQAVRVNQLGDHVRASAERLNSLASDVSSAPDVEHLRRSVEAASEDVATVRSKLKRVETQVSDVTRKAEESIALSGAFEQSVGEGLNQIRASVSSLAGTVKEIKETVPSMATDATITSQTSNHELVAKVDALETNLKALKRLIESSLRTRLHAESIVKEQVSLITKHVCVAMRQYTARRISENNALIDRALRARIPEYAQNDDQFVLVREEDLEGNDSTVGIHRSTHIASKAGS